MENVLYVPGLQKNILSISVLEEKGFQVAFVDGQVLMWPRGKNIDHVVMIGIHEDGLYKLKGKADQALVHSTAINPCELWHRRFAHIHYKALPIINKMVKGLPENQVFHDGECKGCAQGKNVKKPFPSNDKEKGVLDLIHLDVCGPMSATSLCGYVY